MKRMLCAVLSLLLLLLPLTGCQSDKPGPSAAPGNLPDIGPYVPDEKISYFFPDGPADTFTPRADYGRLVPYFGEAVRVESRPYYIDEETGKRVYYEDALVSTDFAASVGLASSDGRIVTAPVWNSVYAYERGGGDGWYLLQYPSEYGEFYSGPRTAVAFDGSWSLEFGGTGMVLSLYEDYGVPYFINADYTDKTAFVYDAGTGEQIGDLGKVLRGNFEETGYYPSFPSVHYVDETMILLSGGTVGEGAGAYYEPWKDGALTAFDWQGNELYSLELDGWIDVMAGVVAIQNKYDDTYRLLDLRGRPLNDHSYDAVAMARGEKLVLASRGSGDAFAVDYYDSRGDRVFPEEDAWTWEKWASLDDPYRHGWSGFGYVFCDENRGVYDAYGREIIFPYPADEIADLKLLYTNDGLEICFLVRSVDGDTCVAGADGTLLAKIRAPRGIGSRYESGSGIATGPDDCLLVLTDEGRLYHYDLKTGKETPLYTDGLGKGFLSSMRSIFWCAAASGPYVSVGGNAPLDGGVGSVAEHALFSLENGGVKTQHLRLCACTDGYLRAADDTASYLYAPNGTLLLKMRFGAYA
ncbi:MAG: hypothetical protein IK104_05430 [Clostridia bacterium]|nr:hypothetical protein [Clostridia bacterium]